MVKLDFVLHQHTNTVEIADIRAERFAVSGNCCSGTGSNIRFGFQHPLVTGVPGKFPFSEGEAARDNAHTVRGNRIGNNNILQGSTCTIHTQGIKDLVFSGISDYTPFCQFFI